MVYSSPTRPMPTKPAGLPSLRKGLPPIGGKIKQVPRFNARPSKFGIGAPQAPMRPGNPRMGRQASRASAIQFLTSGAQGEPGSLNKLLLGRMRGGRASPDRPFLNELITALLQGL